MNRIRLAKPEEIESIKETSDLTPDALVLALDTQAGTPTAVIRTVVEVDPVNFPLGFPDRLKYMFMRDIETFLSAKGVPAYYFNIHSNDPDYIASMTHFGAQQTSTQEEYRFRKTL